MKEGLIVYYDNREETIKCIVLSEYIQIRQHKEGNYMAYVWVIPFKLKDSEKYEEDAFEVSICQIFQNKFFAH